MFRLIITLFAFMLLPFQAVAFYDENEQSSSSANIPPDFPEDGRYEAYHGGVKPVIPMNTEDASYDLWKIPREDLSKGREPGPIGPAGRGGC